MGCVDVCRLVKVGVHTLVGVQRSVHVCVSTERVCGTDHPRGLLGQNAEP